MLKRISVCMAAVGLIASAHAFEPGSERVCTPSADGQRFECHEKSGATATPVKAIPAEQAIASPASVASTEDAEPAAAIVSDVPNYLLQKPNASRPVRRVEPEASTPASAASTTAVDAAPVRVQPTDTETTSASASSTVPASAKIEPAAIAPSPEPQAETTVATTPASSAQAVEPVMLSAAPAAMPVAPSRALNIGDASDFLGLPSNHFTLVLASVRNATALDALILALDNLPGQLYLLKLDMPDGDWYSLCWSQFDDLDAARTARASLPADAAITSGWPRKIGLLQKEITR